jgi:hypothetical protein
MKMSKTGLAKIQSASTNKLRITLAQSLELAKSNPTERVYVVINAINDELARRTQKDD